MGDFGSGPAYGNWGGDPGHEGASRPMDSLKGGHGRDWVQQPMTSVAQTGGRVSGDAAAPGPGWDDCFRAPMATPTRGN